MGKCEKVYRFCLLVGLVLFLAEIGVVILHLGFAQIIHNALLITIAGASVVAIVYTAFEMFHAADKVK